MRTTVHINIAEGVDPFAHRISRSKRAKVREFQAVVKKLVSGSIASRGTSRPTMIAGTAAASGTVTLSGSSGTVGATINGAAVTTAFATSDTVTAAALAAAINASANALVKDLVTATSAGGVVTITAVRKGKSGNCITLAASGTGATASVARLAGGTETTLAF